MHQIKYQVMNLDNCLADCSIVFDNTSPVEASYVQEYFTENFQNILYINHQERQILLGDIGREINFTIPCPIPTSQLIVLVPSGYDQIVLIDTEGVITGISMIPNEGYEMIENPKVEDKRFVRNKVSTFIETPELFNHQLLQNKKIAKLIKI